LLPTIGTTLREDQIDRLIDMLYHFDELGDVATLVGLACGEDPDC
jgi:hypothetical protein